MVKKLQLITSENVKLTEKSKKFAIWSIASDFPLEMEKNLNFHQVETRQLFYYLR